MNGIIDLKPIQKERVSAKEYLRLCREGKKNISASRFIPPKIGDRGFGAFEITYKRPVYNTNHG